MIKIALDGPSGAGKSTLAKAVAEKMGIVYVDTGALYRAIGLYVYRAGTDPKDEKAVGLLLPQIKLTLVFENGTQKVMLCGEDVGGLIRTQEMSRYASDVSALPCVRAFLLDTQRSIAKTQNVVMDGRDIGTVIIPDADVKLFVTASPEARAERRFNELLSKGQTVTLDEVRKTMAQRDKNDSERKIAPAVPAADAVIFDNSGMTPGEMTDAAMKIINEKLKGRI